VSSCACEKGDSEKGVPYSYPVLVNSSVPSFACEKGECEIGVPVF
jgi:hypothetical protein